MTWVLDKEVSYTKGTIKENTIIKRRKLKWRNNDISSRNLCSKETISFARNMGTKGQTTLNLRNGLKGRRKVTL